MLILYNSLSKAIEPFTPLKDKTVRMYVCGVTPYDTTHLGHAFTYISFDVLVKYLQYSGYDVIYTQNVTDINDRDNDILERAKQQHVPWTKLASFWTEKFLHDMQLLNWTSPNNYLMASEQIPSMIQIIERIITNEIAYVVNGDVFLDITKVSNFGKLSRLTPDEMLVKAKEFEEDINNMKKKHQLDITLWKAFTPNQPSHIPSFSSPWGMGRPGWHIECSAMSIATLGEQIDIHGGGIDLIYPHHESEIAQSEAATKKIPFAKYWIHTGTVHINGQKMSKSLGNLILVSELSKKYSANAIRWVLLSHHYRDPWNYDENEFIAAKEIVNKFVILSEAKRRFAETSTLGVNLPKKEDPSAKPQDDTFQKRVLTAMDNDLDTPKALQLIKEELDKPQPNSQAVSKLLTMLGFII